MFDNLKKIAELKKIQDNLKKEEATIEKSGISVTVNGNFELKQLKLNPSLDIQDQEKVIMEAINEAHKEIQQKMAKSLMGSGLGF